MIHVREHQRKEPIKPADPFAPVMEARRRAYAKRWGVELPEYVSTSDRRVMGMTHAEAQKLRTQFMQDSLNAIAASDMQHDADRYKAQMTRPSLASIIGDIRDLVKVWNRIGGGS